MPTNPIYQSLANEAPCSIITVELCLSVFVGKYRVSGARGKTGMHPDMRGVQVVAFAYGNDTSVNIHYRGKQRGVSHVEGGGRRKER